MREVKESTEEKIDLQKNTCMENTTQTHRHSNKNLHQILIHASSALQIEHLANYDKFITLTNFAMIDRIGSVLASIEIVAMAKNSKQKKLSSKLM